MSAQCEGKCGYHYQPAAVGESVAFAAAAPAASLLRFAGTLAAVVVAAPVAAIVAVPAVATATLAECAFGPAEGLSLPLLPAAATVQVSAHAVAGVADILAVAVDTVAAILEAVAAVPLSSVTQNTLY